MLYTKSRHICVFVVNYECPEDREKCTSGHCFPTEYKCDGDRDCDDASDEANCPTRFPGGRYCAEDKFQCDNNVSIYIQRMNERDRKNLSPEVPHSNYVAYYIFRSFPVAKQLKKFVLFVFQLSHRLPNLPNLSQFHLCQVYICYSINKHYSLRSVSRLSGSVTAMMIAAMDRMKQQNNAARYRATVTTDSSVRTASVRTDSPCVMELTIVEMDRMKTTSLSVCNFYHLL